MAIGPGAAAAVILGVFGLVIGSFANVVIYRVPAGRSDRKAGLWLPEPAGPGSGRSTISPSSPGWS